MDGTEFVIALVAIGCLTSLIKTWINRHGEDNQIDKETFNRLAQAFIQHKKDMQERLENLEAIIAEGEDQIDEDQYPQIDQNRDESRLTNDLQQKDRVR